MVTTKRKHLTMQHSKATAANQATKKPPMRKAAVAPQKSAPLLAPNSPAKYRVRIRMYRQGLGDCFLLTFPRSKEQAFNILIDCGALARNKTFMSGIVEHIRDTVRGDATNKKARLDVVIGTHEHKDHVSGFNQARHIFNNDFEFGSVWLAWTENLSNPEILKIKQTRKMALEALRVVGNSKLSATAAPLQGLTELLEFSANDDSAGDSKVADAMEYLKLRGKDSGDIRFLEPGGEPFELDGVDDVQVYVLGPPRDPVAFKTSKVTEKMKNDGVVYHLSSSGMAGIDALAAAWRSMGVGIADRFSPFAAEHRITRTIHTLGTTSPKTNLHFAEIMGEVATKYDEKNQEWRRIDNDWLGAFGQLALDLDSDTNNTSLVLAFEFKRTREVLLFVADAQVGSWLSWANLEFTLPGSSKPLSALDLLRRTVFYKVGHHCSHNATLKEGGLELMTREDLVAFIPLDKKTASNQGKYGWEMPAPPLFKALLNKTSGRVVISDVKENLTSNAKKASIRATNTFVDYFLL